VEHLKDVPGVFTRNGKLYTESSLPGKRVYGERLVTDGGTEYREWSPRRSKLSAYLTNGGRVFPFTETSSVLYLGASGGTTASHVSDVCVKGKIICVEISKRMFRDLVTVCEGRPNMIPVLGDATKPEEYLFASDRVEIVYQDVAQKRQAEIAADNAEAFGAEYGMLCVKANSEDVAKEPKAVYAEAESVLRGRGFAILDSRSLEPYEKNHVMIVFGAKK
jgi:fibrillarin-like pre-rRNA processing protein